MVVDARTQRDLIGSFEMEFLIYNWHEMTWNDSVSYRSRNGSCFGWSAKNGAI